MVLKLLFTFILIIQFYIGGTIGYFKLGTKNDLKRLKKLWKTYIDYLN